MTIISAFVNHLTYRYQKCRRYHFMRFSERKMALFKQRSAKPLRMLSTTLNLLRLRSHNPTIIVPPPLYNKLGIIHKIISCSDRVVHQGISSAYATPGAQMLDSSRLSSRFGFKKISTSYSIIVKEICLNAVMNQNQCTKRCFVLRKFLARFSRY